MMEWRMKKSCAMSMLLLVGATLVLATGCKGRETAAAPPPPSVDVVEVVQQDVPVVAEWIASTDGMVNATIRAQVQGYLIAQHYREGDFVKRGQLLFEIDPRPFQATLNQAQATLNQTQAALAQAEAMLNQAQAEVTRQEALWVNARATFARIKQLTDEGVVSRKDLDDATGAEQSTRAAAASAKAAVGSAQANMGANQAAVAAGQAAVEKVRLDLEFTKIVSPIDGIAGIAKAQLGNLVGPGSTDEMTTVSTVNPIKVYLPISEQEYLAQAKQGDGSMRYTSVQLVLADGSVYPSREGWRSPIGRWMSRPGRSRSPPSSPIQAISSGRGSSLGSGRSARSSTAPCWSRSGRSRSCRAAIRWPSSAQTARWTSGRSRRPCASAPCG